MRVQRERGDDALPPCVEEVVGRGGDDELRPPRLGNRRCDQRRVEMAVVLRREDQRRRFVAPAADPPAGRRRRPPGRPGLTTSRNGPLGDHLARRLGRRRAAPTRSRSWHRASTAPAVRRAPRHAGFAVGEADIATRVEPRCNVALRDFADGASPRRSPVDRVGTSGAPLTCTSATISAGTCRWLIVGLRPTTSLAISNASSIVDAG